MIDVGDNREIADMLLHAWVNYSNFLIAIISNQIQNSNNLILEIGIWQLFRSIRLIRN
jgi:hypothetical protein